jgi:hypothetical protein
LQHVCRLNHFTSLVRLAHKRPFFVTHTTGPLWQRCRPSSPCSTHHNAHPIAIAHPPAQPGLPPTTRCVGCYNAPDQYKTHRKKTTSIRAPGHNVQHGLHHTTSKETTHENYMFLPQAHPPAPPGLPPMPRCMGCCTHQTYRNDAKYWHCNIKPNAELFTPHRLSRPRALPGLQRAPPA